MPLEWRKKLEAFLFVDEEATSLQQERLDDELEQAATTIVSDDSTPVWKTMLRFLGPGFLVSVGYLDPGNWATDLRGGAKFEYDLLAVVLVSSVSAMVLQALCIKLGVVTGNDLAQQCRKSFSRPVNAVLYILAELAIMATDLAEVVGCAIALNLLFKIPHIWGVFITAVDVLVILRWWGRKYQRVYEFAVFLLVLIVGVCFAIQLVYLKPDTAKVFFGFIPKLSLLTEPERLGLSIAIFGATVMPHNLYLHSSVCKNKIIRKPFSTAEGEFIELTSSNISSPSGSTASGLGATDLDAPNVHSPSNLDSLSLTIKYATLDSTVALSFALFVNAAILIVAAAAFYANDERDIQELPAAYNYLNEHVHSGIGTIFAIGLLASGQSSTITGTMAGQIVMSGFLDMKLRPWIRRVFTRALAIIPAVVTFLIYGADGMNNLLIFSQVILSFQLPFAVLPLVLFTSSSRIMGNSDAVVDLAWFRRNEESYSGMKGGEIFRNNFTLKFVSFFIALLISFLNLYLLIVTVLL